MPEITVARSQPALFELPETEKPPALFELPEGPAQRRCWSCHVTRPIAMFYVTSEKRRTEHDGRRSPVRMACRFCIREKNRAHRKPRQDYMDAVKLATGCADCGLMSPHPEVYDFDHLPQFGKVTEISTFLNKGTMDELIAEIAKCEVVCANCHRIRTRARVAVTFGRSWTDGGRIRPKTLRSLRTRKRVVTAAPDVA